MLATHSQPFVNHFRAEDHYQFPVGSGGMEPFERGHEQRTPCKVAELFGQIATVARSASGCHDDVDIVGRGDFNGPYIIMCSHYLLEGDRFGASAWMSFCLSVSKRKPAGSRVGNSPGRSFNGSNWYFGLTKSVIEILISID